MNLGLAQRAPRADTYLGVGFYAQGEAKPLYLQNFARHSC